MSVSRVEFLSNLAMRKGSPDLGEKEQEHAG
jgi:hypothetical protein